MYIYICVYIVYINSSYICIGITCSETTCVPYNMRMYTTIPGSALFGFPALHREGWQNTKHARHKYDLFVAYRNFSIVYSASDSNWNEVSHTYIYVYIYIFT